MRLRRRCHGRSRVLIGEADPDDHCCAAAADRYPTVVRSHTDAKNQHLTSDPDGDAYNQKWVHLVLERVVRFRADVDFRHRRVASFLPVIPDATPPYHLVDPTHLNSNIAATPPR